MIFLLALAEGFVATFQDAPDRGVGCRILQTPGFIGKASVVIARHNHLLAVRILEKLSTNLPISFFDS